MKLDAAPEGCKMFQKKQDTETKLFSGEYFNGNSKK